LKDVIHTIVCTTMNIRFIGMINRTFLPLKRLCVHRDNKIMWGGFPHESLKCWKMYSPC